jgi:hypothetical protein
MELSEQQYTTFSIEFCHSKINQCMKIELKN